jgi:signal transduction histidine kinase/CheY-like chemotaxis protein
VLSETSTPALPNNAVYRVEEDASGRIYLTTNRGVARLTPREPDAANQAPFAVLTFTTDDGLPNNECNAGASAVDPRGRIWVGTVGGAAVFDPSAEIADAVAGPLRIERAWLTGRDRAFAANATLAYDENQCAFEYALLDFSHEEATRYRTQLIGLEKAPSAWTADFKREFTNLPAGDYVFAVSARDHAGNESGPVTYAFTVRAAPWRTWWAYTLYGVAFWGLVWVAFRLRVRTLKRRNELLRAGIRERTAEIAHKVAELEASERRALEEKQRAVEADRAKTAFLAKMSHELRTPLNAIIGFVQLMERDRHRAPSDRENLAVVARSSENLLALIVDLLAVSKIEAGGATLEEHAFDLHRLLRGIEEMFGVEAHAKGLHFRFDLPADLPRYASGDENKLRQVLIKVLANAVKYTHRGSVTTTMSWRDDRATFVVEDTGQGIPAEDLERIFSPFVQGQPDASFQGGAGLGLTVARAFVGLMDGQMHIVSEPGEGTTVTFVVRLPLARGTEPMVEVRRVVGLEPGQRPPRILVADDTWENRTLVARMLASVGFEIRETRTGDEALAIWAEWHPDLVWLDTRLPGIDGLAVAREIRRREGVRGQGSGIGEDKDRPGNDSDPDPRPLTPDSSPTRLVATTAFDAEQERTAIFDAGCDQCVVKPCSEAAVFEALATQLGVRYVFDEPGPLDEPYPSDAPLLPEHLADLPPALVEQLRKGVMEGDVEAASAAADRLRAFDERVAQSLRRMVRTYRFDEVQELIDAMRA